MPENRPKAGEVWETKSGRLALIVHGPYKVWSQETGYLVHTMLPLMMLWRNASGEWTVSELMDKLAYKHECKQEEFFARASSW